VSNNVVQPLRRSARLRGEKPTILP
jgi:hypothetical protein